MKISNAESVLDYPELLEFLRAHFRNVDEKLAVDVVPKKELKQINDEIKQIKNSALAEYIENNFDYPQSQKSLTSKNCSLTKYIKMWYNTMVTKQSNSTDQSTLIQLPYAYIKAGGRFEEMYYWDSYFIALGLNALGKHSQVEDLTRCMAWEVEKFGFIPNASRLYYLDRSQPPVFTLMLKMNKPEVVQELLPALVKELNWWYKMRQKTSSFGQLAYYSSSLNTARAESYTADFTTSLLIPDDKKPELFMHLRAAAESGWDFSSRWLEVEDDLSSIRTSNLFAVDLNCLLYIAEDFLGKNGIGDFEHRANIRAELINEVFWDEDAKIYTDFDFHNNCLSPRATLAMVFPLFAKIATDQKAAYIAEFIKNNLLKTGGLLTTAVISGQQWDAPNGWAPLQWITVKALNNYGFSTLADEITTRWVNLCEEVYSSTGKMFEKYNVLNPEKTATGGEYLVQDGFGWTNGVYLDLKHNMQSKI
ncbi:MAG: hypothetical protein LBI63_05890 [Candidatus Ancillula sp.]|jgi:alpha,alpha-trehalase|nr:hypothetical protein [Candidatus Ancillula sp.]